MNTLVRLMLRLRAVVAHRALESDMQEEMRAHLDRAAERLVARGMTLADARLAAKREFGNVALLQEEARDARGARWVEELTSDLRFALRYFASRPLTTAMIVAVLALGIGANTVTVAILQGFTVRPAPGVPKDDAHVRVHGLERPSKTAPWRARQYSYQEVLALAEHKTTFSDVGGWASRHVVLNATDTSAAEGAQVEVVTPNFFSLLGVRLAAGRSFADESAAVLSYRAAEELFGSATSAVGQRILIDGTPIHVVGVAPPRFQGAIPNSGRPTLWLPLSTMTAIERSASRELDSPTLSVFARLAPGVTHEQASSVARDVAARTLPDSVARLGGTRRSQVLAMRSSPPAVDADDNGNLLLIGAASLSALLILLVACTNVSSLLVASAIARRHEIAVRLSLGASRARLLRQLLTESALLSIAGGTLGLLLYWWATLFLGRQIAAFGIEMAPDFATVAFTVLLAVSTGIVLGLSPALHATSVGVGTALRDSGAGLTRRSRLQRAFVVAQIVFSQPLLLMLAIAIVSTIPRTQPMQLATSERVIRATFRPPTTGAGSSPRQRPVDSLGSRIGRHSGVVSVVPEATTFDARTVTIQASASSRSASSATPTIFSVEGIAPGYFGILDVPIVLGRDVALADTAGAEYNVVIDTDIARALWGTEIPIGKTITSAELRSGARDSIAMRVVGVFDARVATTQGRAGHRIYTANGKHWRDDALLIRTNGPAQTFVPTLRAIIRDESPTLPIASLETLAGINERSRNSLRSVAAGLGGAGALGLLLASLGLYGVIALAVGQRRREIGIRLTVGATPLDVASMFLSSGIRLTGLGLLLGLPISIAGVRLLMSSALMELTMSIWMIGAVIAATMFVVAAAAAWLPARRAAHLDPAATLRTE